MADGNPDDHQEDSTAVGVSGAVGYSRDSCDKLDDITTASNSNSAVAEGLYSLISSVLTGFDSRAEATVRSQDQLAFTLDRLTGELDKLLEDAPSPFIMQHAARISGVRKRVKALNTVLKSIQRRIDNMDRMLSAGLSHGITFFFSSSFFSLSRFSVLWVEGREELVTEMISGLFITVQL
ncbi:UNVERIFIED_CONTAM: hypothetical protein Scaly_2178400 [Sesamum calycinum]|uniref:Biogenesis of lysosome-related organelles complex 1 subunit 7 n=1 Tax=Sesamum calycinum TaxID=2727403 RepID=A0AAW2MPU5_9LAMI